MSNPLSQTELRRMSVAERLELLEEIWDSLPDSDMQVPDWHKAELEHRIADYEACPGSTAMSWNKVRDALLKDLE